MRNSLYAPDRIIERHLADEKKRLEEAEDDGRPFWTAYHPAKAANFLMEVLTCDRWSIREKRVIYKSMLPQIRLMNNKDKDRIRERCAELKEEQS